MYRKRKVRRQMKAKFEEFNDGIVDVYDVNAEDRLEKVKEGLRFGNENVGIRRHYAAQAADSRVDRMIHVLYQLDIVPHQVVVIDGEQYDIDKADYIKDTLPSITKLTLIKLEKHQERDFEDGCS